MNDTERVQKVQELLDAGPVEMWDWDKDGPSIIGEITGGFTGKTKFNPATPVLTVRVLDGDAEGQIRNIWLTTEALKDKVQRQFPQVGEVVGIQRLGKEVSAQTGNEYWVFNVVKLGATNRAIAWDAPAALGEPVDAEVVDE